VHVFHQRRKLRMRKVLVLDAQSYGKCEATTLTSTDRHLADDLGVVGLFYLLGDKIKSAAKAGLVTCRKEMFRCRGKAIAGRSWVISNLIASGWATSAAAARSTRISPSAERFGA
jgi:hypothetical protein